MLKNESKSPSLKETGYKKGCWQPIRECLSSHSEENRRLWGTDFSFVSPRCWAADSAMRMSYL